MEPTPFTLYDYKSERNKRLNPANHLAGQSANTSENVKSAYKEWTDSANLSHNANMDTSVSRDEMNAKLEAMNANMRANEARVDARIDRLATIVEQATKDTQAFMSRAEQLSGEIKTESRNTRWTVIVTGVAVVGLLLAGYAITNSWLQTNAGIINGNLQTQVADMKSSIQDLSKQIGALPKSTTQPGSHARH